MANIKISALPQVNTVLGTDVVPTVASSATSKITITDLANSLPQVSSSISASYALTASHALNVTSINTGSFITTGSNSITQNISGSLNITGSFTQNGFVVLTQVSRSLNFGDDSIAAANGVPLGGLYRNGNVIAIRIS
jgi:hypothetical protein